MIHNDQGKAVWDFHYTEKPESFCPICEGELIAKRPSSNVVWHWAHRPKHRADCPHYESHWHLAAKIAQSRLPNWVIEYPIQTSAKKYRVDAYNTKHGYIREFVHTVTPYYYEKHLALRKERHSHINWVFDGKYYLSGRLSWLKKGNGIKNLLVPRAWELFERIGGMVHFQNQLWNHWKDNIWYPYAHEDAARFIQSFEQVEKELQTTTLAEILKAAKTRQAAHSDSTTRDSLTNHTEPSVPT